MKKFTFIAIALMATIFFGSNAFAQITQRGNEPTDNTLALISGNQTLTITKPTGVVSGDVMIAVFAFSDDDAVVMTANATASGWTEVSSAQLAAVGNVERRATILYRVADGTDGANYTFSVGPDADAAVGTIFAFYNVNSTTGVKADGSPGGPFAIDPGNLNGFANDAQLNASSITPVPTGAAIVMIGMVGDNQGFSNWNTATSGVLTQLFEDEVNPSGGDNDLGTGAAWTTQVTAGPTGAGTADIDGAGDNGSMLLALKPIIVNAGPDQLVGGTSVSLSGSTDAGAPTYVWTRTGGPAGPVIVTPGSASTSVTGLVSGNVYTFRLTVNGSPFDEVSVRVLTGTNLWATSTDGNQISSYTVSSGAYVSGPTNMFAPLGGSTAALGRTDKTSATSGYFYWLPNSGTGGVVNIYAASAAGNDRTLIATFDVNGGSGNDLGYVRLGMGPDGTGWILARESTTNTIYLAKFMSNGLNPVTVTVEDASVALTGGVNADFVNGDICTDAGGKLYALANNGSGVTQIFIGSPAGGGTTLVKKWDLVDPFNIPFTGTVNGVAFDVLGALYISTGAGLYYIDPATVNGPAGTVECSLVDAQTGLQDLASNVFPTTILLPIKLGAFTVTKQGNNALLNWTTASEMNTDHFVIERSYDGVNFVSVGTKNAAGYSSTDIQYSFADPISVQSGIIYYRLRTIDIDAKESLSKIIPLRLSGGMVKNFTVYPNPFNNNLKIEINTVKETEVTVRLYNAAGQTMVNRKTLLQKGDNVIVLSSELSALQAGMYVVEIISEDGKQAQKIIKR